MRRQLQVTVACGLLAGCIHFRRDPTVEETQAARRAEYAEANRKRDEYSAKREEEGRRQTEERSARARAEEADRARAQQAHAAQARLDADESKVADCAAERPQRETEMKRWMESDDAIGVLVEWEEKHCKFVDRGHMVRAVYRDRNGDHVVEEWNPSIERVCNARPPKGIEKTHAEDLRGYQIPSGVSEKNVRCRDEDVKVSEVARTYWAR
jgi:hypothetical protein